MAGMVNILPSGGMTWMCLGVVLKVGVVLGIIILLETFGGHVGFRNYHP